MTRPVRYKPVDMRDVAEVLIDLHVEADQSGNPWTFRAAARATAPWFDQADVTTDTIDNLVKNAVKDMPSMRPTTRGAIEWRLYLVGDVARRLAWLTDPDDDAAICYWCDAEVFAPRAELARGVAECRACDRVVTRVTLPQVSPAKNKDAVA